jgi:heme/copper-type cytochrome/quinol oxidase subunit 3
MIELIGILLVVQGGGGLINRLVGSGQPSWFVQLHVLPPQLHVIASIVLLAAGVLVLFAHQSRKRRRG